MMNTYGIDSSMDLRFALEFQLTFESRGGFTGLLDSTCNNGNGILVPENGKGLDLWIEIEWILGRIIAILCSDFV